MTDGLSDALLKIVLMAAALCCAVLLLRDGFAIGLHVPLDPNEGWNAYHAQAAMTGRDLYSPGLMVNNYPPLSFYVVGALGRSLGDYILAGRLISLVSFLAVAMGLAVLIREIGGRVLDGIFAALFFAGALLIASDYVAMDDPQLLGHALQIQALVLLWRKRPAIALAALLLTAGVFVKQNLIALPLAALVWLALREPGKAVWLGACGLGFGLLGLLVAWAGLDANLLAQMAAPRIWSLANFSAAMEHYLSWAALPLLLVAWAGWRLRHDPWMRFCLLYAAIALVVGMGFSAGDGVDANIFFDLDIAMALGIGVALGRLPWRGFLALACAAPLALFLGRNFHDGNFTYSEVFQRQVPPDITFIQIRKGSALCENLALCYWAGKAAMVDVFNMSEQFRTGARSDTVLAGMVRARRFDVIQLDTLEPFALGRTVRAAMNKAYRVERIDDNGVFLVRR